MRLGGAALRLTLGAALFLAASCVSATGSARIATDKVDLPKSYLFSPADIVVRGGGTVTWTNSDNFTHSVQWLEGPDLVGRTKVMTPGEGVTFTLTKLGSYRYQCSFHPQQMKGTVSVTGP